MSKSLLDYLPSGFSEGVKFKGVDTDNAVALRVRHRLGTGSIAVSTSSITFYSDNGSTTEGGANADNFPDETGLSNGVITLGSGRFNTLEGILDVINESKDWDATLEGGLKTDTVTTSTFIAVTASSSANDVQSVGGYGLLFDTTTVKFHAVGVSEAFRSMGASDDSGWGHVLYKVYGTATGTGTADPLIYEYDDQNETLVYTGSDIIASAQTVENNVAPIHTAYGKRLVVRTSAATTMTAATISVTSQSVRVVQGKLSPRKYKSSRTFAA